MYSTLQTVHYKKEFPTMILVELRQTEARVVVVLEKKGLGIPFFCPFSEVECRSSNTPLVTVSHKASKFTQLKFLSPPYSIVLAPRYLVFRDNGNR